MPVSYNLPTINDRLDAVIANIDAGPSFGQLRLISAANQTAALITLQKPSATSAGGVLTFLGLPLGAPALVNISSSILLTMADVEDSTGQVVISGLTVGLSTAYDIVMTTNTVHVGEIISLTSATITGV